MFIFINRLEYAIILVNQHRIHIRTFGKFDFDPLGINRCKNHWMSIQIFKALCWWHSIHQIQLFFIRKKKYFFLFSLSVLFLLFLLSSIKSLYASIYCHWQIVEKRSSHTSFLLPNRFYVLNIFHIHIHMLAIYS